MEKNKKIVIIISILIGIVFLFFGFSEMQKKKQAEAQRIAIENAVMGTNNDMSSSDGLENIAE